MPPDDKSQKRVEKLFSDLEQIATLREPLKDGENNSAEKESTPAPLSPPADGSSASGREVDALLLRIRELEAQIQQSEPRAANHAAAILYEKEEVGYAFSRDQLSPIYKSNAPAGKSENAITTPLTASGETIGEMQVNPPAERAWSEEEKNLANAVAQQVSLQIQNLRLLSAAERARAEAQAANRQFTHQNWESFMDGIRNSERIGYMYDQASVAPIAESTPNQPDIQETINVLDENIGSLSLKADPAHPLTNADKEMISAVARQVSQQVENLRLLADASHARANAEEATRRLTRENWQSYINQKSNALGFAYDLTQVTPYKETQTIQDVIFEQPLIVRGETIGQLTVAGLKTISPEELLLANDIV